MELFEWMTSTTWGESLLTLLVSMVPVIELRGGVPFGTALGLAPLHALVVCIIGNMLPIPFIIVISAGSFTGCAADPPGSTLWWTSWRRRPT